MEKLVETKNIHMGIRARMLLFFGGAVAVSLVSLSLLNLFGIPFTEIKGSYHIHRYEVIQKINDLADLKKEELQHRFEERINQIKIFAEDISLDDIAERLKKGTARGYDKDSLLAGIRNTGEYRNILQRSRSVLKNYPDYSEIRIADIKTGLVIFSTDEEKSGVILSEDEGIKKAGVSGAAEQVYFNKEKLSGDKNLNIIYPIAPKRPAGDEKKPSLAIMFIIDPEKLLTPILHTGTGLGRSGEIIMIDMNRIILTPLKYPLPGNRRAEPLEYILDTKPAELAAWGIDGVVFAKDYRSVPVIAAVRHMRITSEFGIGLISKINEEEILNFARQGLTSSLLVSGFGLTILLWLIYVFSGRIARPVTQLSQTARKIMDGNLGERSSIKTTDEVGLLAGSFNKMIDEIQKWHKELEIKVRERTALLSESEERFRTVASNTPDHILMQDSELRYTFVVNPQLGLTEQDMLGKTDYDFLSTEEADKLTKPKRRILETGEPMHFETSLISSEGKPEFFDGTYVPKYDAQGHINGLIGYFRNVTERKKAEERISRLSRLYSVLSKINEAIIRTDEPEELYRQMCSIIVAEGSFRMAWIGIVDADTLLVNPVAVSGHEDGYLREKRISIDENTPEGRGPTGTAIRKGGYFVCNDIENDLAMLPWRDEALKRGYRSSAAITLKSGTKIIGSLNIYSSVARFFQEEDDEIKLLKALAEDISYAIESIEIEKLRKKAEHELQKLTIELENRVKGRTAELTDSQRALMSIVEDLNQKSEDLRSANERLKELDRLKSIFIASMSHELRTPLNSIIGFSSIMLNEWVGPMNPEQKDNMGIILRSGRHLLSLINDVIDISKIEAEKIDVVIGEFDLYDLFSEAVSAHSKDIQDKRIGLKVEPLHRLMNTDRRRLLQCILNLLSNAVKFTEKGSLCLAARLVSSESATKIGGLAAVNSESAIKIGGSAAVNSEQTINNGNFVEISVVDTGIGIKEEDLPKLFFPFIRLDSPLKGTVPGTGLGLYLTKKLVNQVLKGEIEVNSRFGEGSTFKIVVPVAI